MGDTRGLLDKTLGDIKTTLAAAILAMETTDINTMAKSIKDRYFKVLAPRSDEVDQLLEEILPSSKVPGAPSVIVSARGGGANRV